MLEPAPVIAELGGGLRDSLSRPIDDLGLSVRSLNSLKNSNIRTLQDLIAYSEEDLLKVKNVGEKAVSEIVELLQKEGLAFGHVLDDVAGVLRAKSADAPAPAAPAVRGDRTGGACTSESRGAGPAPSDG